MASGTNLGWRWSPHTSISAHLLVRVTPARRCALRASQSSPQFTMTSSVHHYEGADMAWQVSTLKPHDDRVGNTWDGRELTASTDQWALREEEFGVVTYPTIAEALRCGGDTLAVDAVLLIGGTRLSLRH